MKMELQTILEVLEEQEDKTESRLDDLDECSHHYHYELGRLSLLREIKSMVQDLLEEQKIILRGDDMNDKCKHCNTETTSETDWETRDVTFTTICKDCGLVLEVKTYEHDIRL